MKAINLFIFHRTSDFNHSVANCTYFWGRWSLNKLFIKTNGNSCQAMSNGQNQTTSHSPAGSPKEWKFSVCLKAAGASEITNSVRTLLPALHHRIRVYLFLNQSLNPGPISGQSHHQYGEEAIVVMWKNVEYFVRKLWNLDPVERCLCLCVETVWLSQSCSPTKWTHRLLRTVIQNWGSLGQPTITTLSECSL